MALHDYLMERGHQLPNCLKGEMIPKDDTPLALRPTMNRDWNFYVVIANFCYAKERRLAARAIRLIKRIKREHRRQNFLFGTWRKLTDNEKELAKIRLKLLVD